jgi:hypothetical protein
MMEEIYTWDDLYSEDSIAPQRERERVGVMPMEKCSRFASKFLIKNEINFRQNFSVS